LKFVVSPTGSHLDSLVANISYQNPPAPLISQYDGYEFMCGDRYTPSTCTEPCTCTHVYHISLGALVDVLIYDKSMYDTIKEINTANYFYTKKILKKIKYMPSTLKN